MYLVKYLKKLTSVIIYFKMKQVKGSTNMFKKKKHKHFSVNRSIICIVFI